MGTILSVLFALFTFGIAVGIVIDPATMHLAPVGGYEKVFAILFSFVGIAGSIHLANG